jgi:hypothetical protein
MDNGHSRQDHLCQLLLYVFADDIGPFAGVLNGVEACPALLTGNLASSDNLDEPDSAQKRHSPTNNKIQ